MNLGRYTSVDVSASHQAVSIQTGKLSAYYGPLATDPVTNDWCFVVTKKSIDGGEKEVFRVTNEILLNHAFGESPKDMFLAGVALYLAK